ncbi:MAG: PaaI family thioesterase [Polyangiaceae bacterium]
MNPEELAAVLNANSDGYNQAMGVRFLRVSRDEVVAELDVGPANRQPYGIVHGGVHAGLAETLASVGAAIDALQTGRIVVGLENHTSFIRAVREGRLTATATPLTRGRRSQLWECRIQDAEARLVATGRVRLLVMEPEGELGASAAAAREAITEPTSKE